MMLEQSGSIPFKNVKDIMTYFDKNLVEKVSRTDLAKRIKIRALRDFCIKSVRKENKEEAKKQKQGGFIHSAGLDARVSLKIAKSPGFGDLLENSCFSCPDKLTSAQSISCIDSLYDHWSQFVDDHQNIDFYLNSNSRAKWQGTMIA